MLTASVLMNHTLPVRRQHPLKLLWTSSTTVWTCKVSCHVCYMPPACKACRKCVRIAKHNCLDVHGRLRPDLTHACAVHYQHTCTLEFSIEFMGVLQGRTAHFAMHDCALIPDLDCSVARYLRNLSTYGH